MPLSGSTASEQRSRGAEHCNVWLDGAQHVAQRTWHLADRIAACTTGPARRGKGRRHCLSQRYRRGGRSWINSPIRPRAPRRTPGLAPCGDSSRGGFEMRDMGTTPSAQLQKWRWSPPVSAVWAAKGVRGYAGPKRARQPGQAGRAAAWPMQLQRPARSSPASVQTRCSLALHATATAPQQVTVKTPRCCPAPVRWADPSARRNRVNGALASRPPAAAAWEMEKGTA